MFLKIFISGTIRKKAYANQEMFAIRIFSTALFGRLEIGSTHVLSFF